MMQYKLVLLKWQMGCSYSQQSLIQAPPPTHFMFNARSLLCSATRAELLIADQL